ncbi:uncharacterized protein LOC144439300 [Glandiceps talaboti]
MSSDVGLSKRRKCVSSTTSSIDSSHTCHPLFKLRPTSSPTCPFGGSAAASGTDSGSSVRAPSTSTWDATHHHLLNFNLHRGRKAPAEYAARFLFENRQDVIIHRIMDTLFMSTPTLNKTFELDPPRIIQDGVVDKSTLKHLIENNEVLKYAINLFNECEIAFNLETVSLEDYPALSKYIHKEVKVKGKTTLREHIITDIKILILKIIACCKKQDSRKEVLDVIIRDMMVLVVVGENCRAEYNINVHEATKRWFEICGSQVTAITKVRMEYNPHTLIPHAVILSENNSGMPEKKSTALRRPYKKTHMEHKKISQVIGQALSVAEKSVFETDDYKIVYHISLMGLEKLVITRTHVAKNTIKKMKEGCLVEKKVASSPSDVEPSPSGVEPSPSKVAPSPSDVEPPPSKVVPSSSDVEPPPSDVAPSPSKVAPSPSDVEPPPSKVVPSSSGVEPPPSDVEPCHSHVELSPSHVVDTSFHLDNNPVNIFLYLYIPTLFLVKLCNFDHQPTVKDAPKTQKRKSKPILKLPSKRKQDEMIPTKKRKKT